MKSNLILATVAAFAVAGAAQAAPIVSFTTITGADTVSGGTIINFDGSGPAFTLTGNYEVRSGAVTNQAAVPQGSVGSYLVVPATGATGGVAPYTATLTFATPLTDITSLSFLWGSVDVFNSVTINQVVGGAYTVSGSQFSPADGTTTARASITGLGGVTSIVFTDNAAINGSFRAFEVDTIQIGSAVPEPAIWGMMVLGFGVVGAALRSSRRKVIFA